MPITKKLQRAIDTARLVEKISDSVPEKLIAQLQSLSIVCDCFGWEDARLYMVSKRTMMMQDKN